MRMPLLNVTIATRKIIGQSFPSSSRRNGALGHTERFVINPATFEADVERIGERFCGHTCSTPNILFYYLCLTLQYAYAICFNDTIFTLSCDIYPISDAHRLHIKTSGRKNGPRPIIFITIVIIVRKYK